MSNEIKKILSCLHPLERKVVPFLNNSKTLSEIEINTKLSQVEVMRALQWLENKNLLKLEAKVEEIIQLDENGLKYLNGLPEKKVIISIKNGASSVTGIIKDTHLSSQEVGVSIGLLKEKNAITVNNSIIQINDFDNFIKNIENNEELFLSKLKEKEINVKDLSNSDKKIYDFLKKRKNIIKTIVKKDWNIKLTKLGEKISNSDLANLEFIERLTPEIIKEKSWKEKEFRRYDVEINVPKIYGGKRHFVNQAIDYAKKIWLEMGFKEMEGNLLDTSFWVFDSLFTAQDHPVREMQDTFFIEDPEYGNLPSKEIVDYVKKSHEVGVDSSTGWKYSWNPKEAQKNCMRPHTTVLSARTLASLRNLKDLKPEKYFVVGKNFRNETVDWSHLFEFNQTDGIVIDPNANFRNLLGYLKLFFKKMGYPDARFRPAFFSYTEPSVEIDVFHPVHKKWVEFGGAGMLRPEVVIPLVGRDIPVLAWGPGFDRIYLEYYNINDIRDLYKNDLKQLRESKIWMK
jgi:phenylalanyl-tRNA synthetase alpha chain